MDKFDINRLLGSGIKIRSQRFYDLKDFENRIFTVEELIKLDLTFNQKKRLREVLATANKYRVFMNTLTDLSVSLVCFLLLIVLSTLFSL